MQSSGAVVDTYGYPVLFTATAMIGIPLVILCFVVRRDTLAVDAKEDDPAPEEGVAVPAGSRS